MNAGWAGAPAPLHVLALNCGASTLKFGFLRVDDDECTTLFDGEVEGLGGEAMSLRAVASGQPAKIAGGADLRTLQDVVLRIRALFLEFNMPAPEAIGHRIVHGGPLLLQHALIDESVEDRMIDAGRLAPLHADHALAVVRFAREYFPWVPQAACFDTVFHARMPAVARTLALPGHLRQEGIRRYGFHGLSCESILEQWPGPLPDRLIIAHLGSGASVTAVKAGHSIDTSMGFTPTGGLPMGTRSGDLDPGVLVYLLREKGFDAQALEQVVTRQSGLLGISGMDADMRVLHAAAPMNSRARLAIEMFCLAVCKQIACMATSLQGVDAIVFTGGIGERDALIRQAICDALGWLGVPPEDAEENPSAFPAGRLGAGVAVRVLPSQEQRMIARHTRNLCMSSA